MQVFFFIFKGFMLEKNRTGRNQFKKMSRQFGRRFLIVKLSAALP
jgi:hypothetical protein